MSRGPRARRGLKIPTATPVFPAAALIATALLTAPRSAWTETQAPSPSAPSTVPASYAPPTYAAPLPRANPDTPNSAAQALTITPRGPHTHKGFYLRLQLGEGFSRLTANNNGRHFEVSGPFTAYTISLGAALRTNVILFGEALVGDFNDTKGKIDGKAAAAANNSLAGIGAGVAYYWPASNVYVAATLMIFQLEAHGHGSSADWGESFEGLVAQQGDAETEPYGAGGEAHVGKEWWISPHWGLGAAGEVFAGLAPDPDFDGNFTWTATSFALLVSATYN